MQRMPARNYAFPITTYCTCVAARPVHLRRPHTAYPICRGKNAAEGCDRDIWQVPAPVGLPELPHYTLPRAARSALQSDTGLSCQGRNEVWIDAALSDCTRAGAKYLTRHLLQAKPQESLAFPVCKL